MKNPHEHEPNKWGAYECRRCGVDVLDEPPEGTECPYHDSRIPSVSRKRTWLEFFFGRKTND